MSIGRRLRILCVHPGAAWATAEVFWGLYHGLKYHDVDVFPYRLDERIESAKRSLRIEHSIKKRSRPDLEPINDADIFYAAGIGSLEMALRKQVDVVLVVSGMLFHPDIVTRLKQAGKPVVVLFTESPYDMEKELKLAAMVDGGWTIERSVVKDFRAVNPKFGYLPHGWDPLVHRTDTQLDDSVPAHDVVFVGTDFRERYRFINSINWSGIDLGLYGRWNTHLLNKHARRCVHDIVDNERAALLYRRAKIGLNLYRLSKGFGSQVPVITHAESVNPRAYELAACGAFFISDFRSESAEVFGDLVPMFRSPIEAAALIRFWLENDQERRQIAAQLPARIAEASWIHRTKTVLGDLQHLLSIGPLKVAIGA